MEKIWAKGKSKIKNFGLSFRYEFDKDYSNILFETAAASTFRAFLNGKFLFAGPCRTAKGFSVIHKHKFESVNRGDVLVVDVCAYNINSFYIVNEEPFFAARISKENKIIAGSADFEAFILSDRIQKTQRYNFQRPFTEAYEMGMCRHNHYLGFYVFHSEETETVTGGELIEGETPLCLFGQASAEKIIESGAVYTQEGVNPLSDRIFLKIDEKVLGFPYDELDIKLSDNALKFRYRPAAEIKQDISADGYNLYDFGQDYSGFIGLEVTCAEDSELYLLFDETLWNECYSLPQYKDVEKEKNPLIFNRTHTCSVIYYKLQKGNYKLLSSEPYTLRYLKIVCVKGKAAVKDMPYIIKWQNDGAYKTVFEISDEKIKKIFNAAQNSLAQNSPDILTDCPGRERAGWLCDSYFTAKAESLICGEPTAENNLLQAYLLNHHYEHIPRGMFPMCYPADHYDGTFIPNWAMWLVLEIYDNFKRTGSRKFAGGFKKRIYRLIKYFDEFLSKDGLLQDIGGWVFVDWGKANNYTAHINYPTNMLYAYMLKQAGMLYGDDLLLKRYNTMKNIIIEKSYDGSFFADNEVNEKGKERGYSEACQYYAFFTGIADKQTFPRLYEIMFNEITPLSPEYQHNGKKLFKAETFIGNMLRFDYLSQIGERRQLLGELIEYFLPMAERTGTLWELTRTDSSLNHGLTACVCNYIIKAVTGFAGYEPDKKRLNFSSALEDYEFTLKLPVNGKTVTVINSPQKGGCDIEIPDDFRLIKEDL